MTIYLSLLVCVVGGLYYLLSAKPKNEELGKLAFACGLLAFLLRVSDATFGILPK